MDHIPLVQNSIFPPVEVEHLGGGVEYDNLGFSDFPRRAGWNKERMLWWLGSSRNPDITWKWSEFAPFLQQWLYFGLLSTALAHEYSMETLLQDFTCVSSNTGRTIITTAKLEQYLQRRKETMCEADLQLGSETQLELEAALQETALHTLRYISSPAETDRNKFGESHPMRAYPELSLSILVLATVIQAAKDFTWPHGKFMAFGHGELVIQRMRSAGWCPSDIIILKRSLLADGLYYISMLAPRRGQKDHVTAGCDDDFCNVMNITGAACEEYQTGHAENCDGQCEFHYVDEANICDIWNSPNSTPVVSFTLEDDQWKLNVSKQDLGNTNEYIAISHVWVEGLGSTAANSLPGCQLQRIQNMVNSTPGRPMGTPTLFWIDTLCVPQDYKKPRLTVFRQKAIRSMDLVYKSAAAVLVLDAELRSTSILATAEEHLARLFCSSWFRRFWTLQEAVLNSNILLQMTDGTIDMMQDIFMRMIRSLRSQMITQRYLSALWGRLRQMQVLRNPAERPHFQDVYTSCWFRSTSQKHDEAICLSILLRLDPEPILKAPDDEKWTTFLLQQRIFPKEIMFIDGPKIRRENFQWAPRSFINQPVTKASPMGLNRDLANATSEGLRLKAAGYIFAEPPDRFVKFVDDYSVFLLPDSTTGNRYRLSPVPNSVMELDITAVEDTLRTSRKFGLILPDKTLGSSQNAVVVGSVRVKIEGSDVVFFARYFKLVTIQEERVLGDLDPVEILTGNPTRVNQEWCVG
jgi:hypothetical protein